MSFLKWCIFAAVCVGFFLFFLVEMMGNIALVLSLFLGIDPSIGVPLGFFLWLAIVVYIGVSTAIKK